MSYSTATLLLLSKFQNGESIKRFSKDENWHRALRRNPAKVISDLGIDGLLEKGGVAEKMNCKFKVSELKPMLKERGLKVSGKKIELIQRLIESDPSAMKKAVRGVKAFKCTAEGLKIIEAYRKKEEEKLLKLEQKLLRLLRKKRLWRVSRAIRKYESSQTFPRGMGIDWSSLIFVDNILLPTLRRIFNNTPEILNRVEETILEELRIGAGMMELFGTGSAIEWLPEDISANIHLDVDTACRMILYHANFLEQLKEYKSWETVREVEISAVGSMSCEECQMISGKRFHIDEVPELPYAKCTCKLGCRCVIIPIGY